MTGTSSAAFVVAGLVVSLTGGSARDVVAIERPPEERRAPATVPAPPTPTTTPQPAPEPRPASADASAARVANVPLATAVVARDGGRWELRATSDGASSCLELRMPSWSSGPLLCDTAAPDDTIGDLVMLAAPAGPAVVAAVDPGVTGARGAATGPVGVVAPDPFRPGLRWFVATDLTELLLTGTDGGLLLERGEDTIARVLLPVNEGTHPAGSYGVLTGDPYGRWDGYRRAGAAGVWLDGVEEVGFHDGATGERCTLHRRFGGSREEVVAELCPPPAPNATVADARLLPTGVAGHHLLHAVTDRMAVHWRCEVPAGATCAVDEPLVLTDPGRSGRRALVGTSPLRITGAARVTLVVIGPGGDELGRVGLEVPAG